MTDTSSLIAQITEQLQPIADQLQLAMKRANEFVNSDFAYQWTIGYASMELNDGSGQMEPHNPQVITVPVCEFGTYFGEPFQWKPVPGEYIVMWPGNMITSAVKQPYPPALEAQNYWVDEIPSIGSNTDAQTKNVYDIINLPKELGTFHSSWTTVLNEVTPLNTAMTAVLGVDSSFTWGGVGYLAYASIAAKYAGAAEATQKAVEVITQGVLSLVEMVLRLVETLKNIAKKNIDDVDRLVDTLTSLWNATKWLQVLTTIGGVVGQNLKDQLDAAVNGAQQIYADAKALEPFGTLQGVMNEQMGQPNTPGTSPYPGWPTPSGDVTGEWSGGANVAVEIEYLVKARQVWKDIAASLGRAHQAAVAGGDIPLVADQSGNFTTLINLLNGLKNHVRDNLLQTGQQRAQGVADNLRRVADLYVLNEVHNAAEVKRFQDMLDG